MSACREYSRLWRSAECRPESQGKERTINTATRGRVLLYYTLYNQLFKITHRGVPTLSSRWSLAQHRSHLSQLIDTLYFIWECSDKLYARTVFILPTFKQRAATWNTLRRRKCLGNLWLVFYCWCHFQNDVCRLYKDYSSRVLCLAGQVVWGN